MSKKLKICIFLSSLLSVYGFFYGLSQGERCYPPPCYSYVKLIEGWGGFSIPLICFILYAIIFKNKN